jgi:DNA-binding transcriptional LysR family regulator
MIDWNDLRYLLAVARHGSTLAAARALALSQSTVHRRLAALEATIGRKLVHRHQTGYRLTKFGTEILPLVERVECAAGDLERHLVLTDSNCAGLVRVACPASAAHRLMAAGLLAIFHARHPRLHAEFIMTEEFLNLAEGEAELMIRQGAPEDPVLIARRIADVPWAVFATESYIARYGRPAGREGLNRHAVVEFAGPMKRHAAALWLRTVAPAATVAARGNSVSEILMAVKTGVGVAPLPVPYASRESDLAIVVESEPRLNFPFYLVIHRDMQRVRRVRAFLDFMAAESKSVRRVLAGAER